jgi:formamidopyrimidine-DNA glycosylase
VPELPEVETIVRDIRPALVGRRITEARLFHSDVLSGVSRRRLLSSLRGSTIRSVSRRAKHAVLLIDGHRLVIQPGMTGSLLVRQRPGTAGRADYVVLRARLDDGSELIYRDIRRLGTLRLLDERRWAAYEATLGPEPLADDFTPSRLRAALAGSRQAIKKVLMDQRHLAGVGNIYANEALFASGVDPSRPANGLTEKEYTRLYGELRRILAAAVAAEGTTVRNYRTGTGQPGAFQLELLVYGREGEPCRRCGTRLAGTHAIDQRITVFCHRCQGGRQDGRIRRRQGGEWPG